MGPPASPMALAAARAAATTSSMSNSTSMSMSASINHSNGSGGTIDRHFDGFDAAGDPGVVAGPASAGATSSAHHGNVASAGGFCMGVEARDGGGGGGGLGVGRGEDMYVGASGGGGFPGGDVRNGRTGVTGGEMMGNGGGQVS